MVIKVGYDGWVQNFTLKLFLNHNFEGKSSLSFSVAVEKADGHVTYFFPIRNLQNRLCLFILETCISVLGNFLLLLKNAHVSTHTHTFSFPCSLFGILILQVFIFLDQSTKIILIISDSPIYYCFVIFLERFS